MSLLNAEIWKFSSRGYSQTVHFDLRRTTIPPHERTFAKLYTLLQRSIPPTWGR